MVFCFFFFFSFPFSFFFAVIAKPPFHVRPLLSFGIADGMFQNPEGMAVSERDEIILADT